MAQPILIPSVNNETQRVEVISDEAGVMVRQATWTEGLGWCSQKTIRLDDTQIEEFYRTLMVVRQSRRRRQPAPSAPSKVLAFPKFGASAEAA